VTASAREGSGADARGAAAPRASAHVFGPVPSRRLGRSLGVDLVPYKVCSYDCVYCQLGRTTRKTVERREWVPTAEVLTQVAERLETVRPDWVTLSGSGEPTLHVGIGEIIDGIKQRTDVPVAVLTNGSLLGDADVASAVAKADLVMPSLDAPDETLFAVVNRPAPEIGFAGMVEGLVEFRRRFTGRLWLEVMVVGGLTDGGVAREGVARLVERITPDRVQLNTVVRPPAEAFAAPASDQALEALVARLGPTAEIVAERRFTGGATEGPESAVIDEIRTLLRRRPCTVSDIAGGLGLRLDEVVKWVDVLIAREEVRYERRGEASFVVPVARNAHETSAPAFSNDKDDKEAP